MTAALNHPTTRIFTGPTVIAPMAEGVTACFHCGTACADRAHRSLDHVFCCAGCQTVYELLREHGLAQYYSLNTSSGRPVTGQPDVGPYAFLDEPTVRSRMVDFANLRIQRITFHVPAIHCGACVWLLENLFRLEPGVGTTTVNLTRREVSIVFNPAQVTLSQIAARLASLGYAPDLKLSDLDARRGSSVPRRLWLQLGVAGFAFGNTMLFSLAGYFGLDAFSGPSFGRLFGVISLVLSIPVIVFSASDYWRAAAVSLRQRRLSLEVPIAVGIAALFVQSVVSVLGRNGEGYFDSLAGLLFFLLCGRVFQQKTFDRLTFDRDYRAFFPLSVCRVSESHSPPHSSPHSSPSEGSHSAVIREERVALAQLKVGDRLRLRHGELVPADSRLISGQAAVDYSFVTGEADPVTKQPGEILYAGGNQTGGLIELEILKPVSQSYLTSLWDQEVFRKAKDDTFDSLTNRYSVRFTWVILTIALGAAGYWWMKDPSRAGRALVGVLIVACPCALALAAPFTLGTAVRLLGRRGIFLRNTQVLESLARVNTVVFDKTGTLTTARSSEVEFIGAALSADESAAIGALAAQSTHPLATRVATQIKAEEFALHSDPNKVRSETHRQIGEFREDSGRGVTGCINTVRWRLGSADWFRRMGITLPLAVAPGSSVLVARDDSYRGQFSFTHALRPEVAQLISRLGDNYELALLSGDNARELPRFQNLFKSATSLRFDQSPFNKLEFVRDRQRAGRTLMMVGDGLNDAGALRQSDVGVAVVDEVGTFSPASDVIIEASRVPRVVEILAFAKAAVRLVRVSFLISTLYNLVGISIAAAGRLSPVVCAVLMPLSSISVVAFSVGVVYWQGHRAGLGPGLTSVEAEGRS